MASYSTTLGNIKLEDPEKSSEQSGAQVFTNLIQDSRIYPQYSCLTYQQIRELRKDPTCQLLRWAVLAPMIHTPWMYQNNKGTASKEMLTYASDNFEPIRNSLLQRMVFGCLDFGWMPFEIVNKAYEGRVYIEEFKSLLQDYTTILVYIDTGRFAGFTNEPLETDQAVIVEEQYAFNAQFSYEGTDWYGESVFEYLKNILSSWNTVETAANRYDRKIAGATWVVWYPVGVTLYQGKKTPNDQIAKSILAVLESSGGVAIPDEIQEWLDDSVDREAKGKWRLELISATGTQQTGFVDRQKYLDALKCRAFAYPERALQEGTHGTKAEADIHGDVALSIVDSRHRILCDLISNGPLRKMMRLNFGKKYQDSVRLIPAPLVDTQFATVKALYERILSNPDALMKELEGLDTKAMRQELALPSVGDEQV